MPSCPKPSPLLVPQLTFRVSTNPTVAGKLHQSVALPNSRRDRTLERSRHVLSLRPLEQLPYLSARLSEVVSAIS